MLQKVVYNYFVDFDLANDNVCAHFNWTLDLKL